MMILTLNLLTTTIVAPHSNASKWQMGFNSAFKGLKATYRNFPNAPLREEYQFPQEVGACFSCIFSQISNLKPRKKML